MTKKLRHGFAALTPARRKEIARQGGKAAQATGRAHRFTVEEAREAGRNGGSTSQARGTAHRFTVEEAREAGKKGGRRKR